MSLRVRELAASVDFYTRVLGCADAGEVNGSSRRRCLRLGQGSTGMVAAIELIAGRPIGAVSGLDHFSVEVATPQGVDSIHQRAVEANSRATTPCDEVGRRRCLVFDPDGHKIEIFARRWDDDDGRHVK